MLKIQTKVTNFVDYNDLEAYIQEVYKLPERFEILESVNDVDYTHNVDGRPYDSGEALKLIRQGHAEYWHLDEILNLLCMDGHIKMGVYVIQVSW